jgi:hypothetical protein
MNQLVSYAPHAAVVWAVDAAGVVVIRTDERRSVRLDTLDCALWDAIARGLGAERAERLMMAVSRCPAATARERIAARIAEWLDAGWIQRSS